MSISVPNLHYDSFQPKHAKIPSSAFLSMICSQLKRVTAALGGAPRFGRSRLSEDEDIYAARVGRTMWRLANRRAREIRDNEPLIRSAYLPDRIPMIENKSASPDQPRDQAPRQAAASPRTLAEFLRALAATLDEDDPDPDGS